MSKLSSSRANLFFVMDLTHFKKHAFNTRNYHILRKKCLNTEFFLVHIWTLFTQWCIFQANVEYFTILRRSSTVIVFFTLPNAPSISISLFLIDFFVEYLLSSMKICFEVNALLKKFLSNFTLLWVDVTFTNSSSKASYGQHNSFSNLVNLPWYSSVALFP